MKKSPNIPFVGYPNERELRLFWAKVNRLEPHQCWLWKAADGGNGYGKHRWQTKLYQAHRFSYYIYHRIDPRDTELDHTCRVLACVNPFHLEPVGSVENKRRALEAHGFCFGSNTTCAMGHELTPDNTFSMPGGKRGCVICAAERLSLKEDFRLDRSAITHCIKGHEYTPENTRINKKGARECRECMNLRNSERREAKNEWRRQNKLKKQSE